MIPLRPCAHRETIPGSLATREDLDLWATAYAAETCQACAAPPPPPPKTAPLPELPAEVAAALLWERAEGARRAQRLLDKLRIGDDMLPAIADRLAHQPSTSPYWMRWWEAWRDGALLRAAPAT